MLMNIEAFIQGITFNQIQAMDPMKQVDDRNQLELSNTLFTADDQTIKQRLRELLQIPKMSTLAIAGIINRCVSDLPANQTFLNIGVWHGFTLLAGVVSNDQKKCIGVDNFSQFGSPRNAFLKFFLKYKTENHSFYDMDYEAYFKEIHQEQIGLYIYDGEHSYDNQLKGLQLAEPFFAPGCIILVDDTNWPEPRQATLDFIAQSSSNYKIILDAPTCSNGHPTFWNGILVFQKI